MLAVSSIGLGPVDFSKISSDALSKYNFPDFLKNFYQDLAVA